MSQDRFSLYLCIGMNAPSLQTQIKEFPEKPGVYLMKDEEGTVIYVGKAKVLRNRVRSYFSGRKDAKTAVLVSKIARIDFLVTQSEYEALILENNLIKEYTPRYNINLKDDKSYPVIRITNEEYPRIFRTRRIIQDGSRYFGPFPQVKTIDLYLEIVDRVHPLRKCRGPLKKRAYPCLYYHIGKCPAPCADLISAEDYRKEADAAAEMIGSPPEKLKEDLRTKMLEASKGLHFEKAAEYRDLIRTIDDIASDQNVEDHDPQTRDYIGWHDREGYQSFLILRMRGGRLVGTDIFRSQGFGEGFDDLALFITRYYDQFRNFPERLYLPVNALTADIQRYFQEELAAETLVLGPEAGRDEAVLGLASENARQDCMKRIHEMGSLPALEELQGVLNLPRLPMRIEGFDIAQLHGKHTVAAMVSFYKGRPDPAQYRKFHIRGLKGGIDDFESIKEAVARRYSRVLNENLPKPDLILIDGGKGQLSSAISVLRALEMDDIPILGLAKQEEEIFLPGRSDSIILPPGNPALRVLQHVRDEAHRFGTGFNQRLRSGDLKMDSLESVPGIGKVRATRLLTSFGSLDAIAEADAEEIAKRAKLPLDLAMAVKRRLNGDVAVEAAPEAGGTTEASAEAEEVAVAEAMPEVLAEVSTEAKEVVLAEVGKEGPPEAGGTTGSGATTEAEGTAKGAGGAALEAATEGAKAPPEAGGTTVAGAATEAEGMPKPAGGGANSSSASAGSQGITGGQDGGYEDKAAEDKPDYE